MFKDKKTKKEHKRHSASGKQTPKAIEAVIVKHTGRILFASAGDTVADIAVSVKFSKGALCGDKVLLKCCEKNGRSEGEIVAVIEENNKITGTVVTSGNRLCVAVAYSEGLIIPIRKTATGGAVLGERVSAEILKRGSKDISDYRCGISKRFGESGSAAVSAKVAIYNAGIRKSFTEEVKSEAKALHSIDIGEEITRRIDLRSSLIFTIDGKDTKDIDDAVSLEKTGTGWTLGIHIADVSHFVKAGSAIDLEAGRRQFSFYYPASVIPMLPKELSCGICSLAPDEDRLCFSCILDLSQDGDIRASSFVKTVIKSRFQGVYSEINEILEGGGTEETKRKYNGALPVLTDMAHLARTLFQKRKDRGAIDFDLPESNIIFGEDDKAVRVETKNRGVSEGIIEEFMLAANNAVATVACEIGLPIIYRTHLSPSAEKLTRLKVVLLAASQDKPPKFDPEKIASSDVLKILNDYKDTPLEIFVNRTLLRSMAKAEYSPLPLGHFGLSEQNYCHFTSPIRRYTDLFCHRIMSEYGQKHKKKLLNSVYEGQATSYATLANSREILFLRTERDIIDFYKAEAMSGYIGDEFSGVITGVTQSGLFITLSNTVEGRVAIGSISEKYLLCDNDYRLFSKDGSEEYKIGDPVCVKLIAANAENKFIDFMLLK